MSRILTTDQFPMEWVRNAKLASDVGPGTAYPVGVDLHRMVRWLFRARKWRLYWEPGYTLSVSGGMSSTISLEMTAVALESTPLLEPFDHESGTLEEPGHVITTTQEETNLDERDVDNYAGGNIAVTGDIRLFEGFGSPRVLFYDAKYYPYLVINGNIAMNAQARNWEGFDEGIPVGGSASYGAAGYFSSLTGENPEEGPPDILEIEVDGQVVACGWALDNPDPDVSGTGASVTPGAFGKPTDVMLEVLEWWPYMLQDGGGPIWDGDGNKRRRNY